MADTPRRALIVIDVQNEYVTGTLRIEYPEISTSLANVGKAMDCAKQHGIPIVVVQQNAPETSPIFAKGSNAWQLHDTVASRPFDHRIEKNLPSAFPGTDLADWLSERGIDTLVVVGYMTHNCVDSTIRQAVHQGMAVEFLSDAAGSLPYANKAGALSAKAMHEAFCVVMQSRFAAVLDTDEWIRLMAQGGTPERDSIFRSHQAAVQNRKP